MMTMPYCVTTAAVAAGAAVILVGTYICCKKQKKKEFPVALKNFRVGVVYLFQFPRQPYLPNASPFCMKLEGYLKFRKIPYELPTLTSMSSPKGQFPYIEIDGRAVADSGFCIEYLEDKFGFHEKLTGDQRALAVAVTRLVENSLYFQLLHFRWNTPEGWKVVSERFFDMLPALIRPFISYSSRCHVKKTCHYQGVSRHSTEELVHLAEKDIEALAHLLGSKKFILGNELTIADMTVYGFLANALTDLFNIPHKEIVRKYDNLMEYHDRVRQKLWDESK
jgi:glutathione S-transferase